MKVVIDPGHGGRDPGAIFRGIKESDIALSIALRLHSMLSASNRIDAKLTRSDDRFITLTKRASIANGWKADLFLSIHLNADPDPDGPGDREAKGHEVWYYTGSREGLMAARRIGAGISTEFPDEPYRGEKSSRNLTVLRATTMTAALAEVAFIDHSDTARKVTQETVQSAIAFGLMRGLLLVAEQ